MSWVEKHLNWTYGIALLVALIVLIIEGFVLLNWVGLVVFYAITFIGGELVLWRKNQLGTCEWFMIAPPIFAIVVLCKQNKREQAKPLAPPSAT